MGRNAICKTLLRQASACFLLVLLMAAGSFPVCAGENVVLTEEIYDGANGARCADVFAMDTYMTLTACGEGADAALEEGIKEIHRLDALLSTGRPSSEISGINAAGGGILSEDTRILIEESLRLYESTGGLFDISIYPVMRLWGFTDRDYRKPGGEELSEALSYVDASRIELTESENGQAEVHFPEGTELDVGGIAKGYTSARLMEIFREHGVEHAIVSLGGNVQALGTKPDGSPWRIGIQDPDGSGYLGVLSESDAAVITSGGYERFFEEDGVLYHHIIDPRTGYPAVSGVKSVSVISGNGMLADGLSTSLFIMGEEAAEEWWRNSGEDFDYILETDDGTLHVTEGVREMLETDRKVEVVMR